MYQIYKNILFSKGYNRTLLYDPLNKMVHFMPNDVFDLIHSDNYILTDQTDQEILDFLLENKLAFKADSSLQECFPAVHDDFDIPYLFITAVIELSFTCAQHLYKFNRDGVNGTILQYNVILSAYTCRESIALLCDFMMESESDTFELTLCQGFMHFEELFYLLEPLNKIIVINNYAGVPLTDASNKKNRFMNALDSFSLQMSFHFVTFFESNSRSVYFNRKLFIGKDTEIKNASESTFVFGFLKHIDDIPLAEINSDPDFTALWNVKKEASLICKDCEFRRFCVDNRVPTKTVSGWKYDLECDYNPYLSKWKHEEGYLSLKESGITINEHDQVLIDMEQLTTINAALWVPNI